MVMPFTVKNATLLTGCASSAAIDFTVVVGGDASYVEDLRVRRYQSPIRNHRSSGVLELLSRWRPGSRRGSSEAGQPVPDFTFTDQQRQRHVFQAHRRGGGPHFYLRAVSEPGLLLPPGRQPVAAQKRFTDRLGKDLVLLTIAIDPALDQGEALADYARTWTTNARAWHFLTGPLETSGASPGVGQFWQDEGSLTHCLYGCRPAGHSWATSTGKVHGPTAATSSRPFLAAGLGYNGRYDSLPVCSRGSCCRGFSARRRARRQPPRTCSRLMARADLRQRTRKGVGLHVDEGRAVGDGASHVGLRVDLGGADTRQRRVLAEGRRA